MGLTETFQEIVDALPDDWTDLEFDLRINDIERYVDAAVALVVCNAQPYSQSNWHWHILVAHRFGHAAAVPAVRTALTLLDDNGITGEIAVCEVREGRAPFEPMWGRPYTVREQQRRINAQ